MKHKHKWQYMERIGPTPLYTFGDDLEPKPWGFVAVNGYTKPYLKFVCECGKTKIVEEK